MNTATADKLSHLRGSYDCALEDLRRFRADVARIERAIDVEAADPLDADLWDDLADAEAEVEAAERRAERARQSLAQAEADARA